MLNMSHTFAEEEALDAPLQIDRSMNARRLQKRYREFQRRSARSIETNPPKTPPMPAFSSQ